MAPLLLSRSRIVTGLKQARNLWEITQPFRAALSRSKHEVYGFRSAATLTF